MTMCLGDLHNLGLEGAPTLPDRRRRLAGEGLIALKLPKDTEKRRCRLKRTPRL